MTETPVVVVGGGPVGMAAALLLARYDIPTTVLEASDQRDPIGSKALCMQRDVLDVLERIGCGDRLLAEGVTWNLGRTYYRDHELFQITFPELGENHYPPFVNVGQDRTEFWLEAAIRDEPLVDLRYGHRMTAIDENDDSVVVTTTTADGPTGFTAEYVIAADGSRSTTRSQLDIDFAGRTFDDQFLICDIRADLGFANERRFFFDPEWNPDRQVLIHPQADSVWRIDWQVPPDFDLEIEQASGGLEQRIRKIVGDADYEVVWMSVYRFHQRIASHFRLGRIFLAGDAAHLVSPFGARGLNSGIQDAENLAWKLGFVTQGWATDALLDTYEIERQAAARENLAVTGATMDFLVPPTEELWQKRRETLRAAVGDPNARTMVDSGQLAVPFDYRDSPLTTVSGPQAAVSPGMLLPDAPIVLAQRGRTRFRSLFGGPFVVVASGDRTGLIPEDIPAESYDLASIDADGILGEALGLPENVAAVARPDGHLTAIVPAAPGPVREALERSIGVRLAGGRATPQ